MITIALTIAALLAAESVPGQDAAVREQLVEADKLVVGQATFTGIEGFGNLSDGDEVVVTHALRRGSEYLVVGVCDTDCSDLDLTATGGDGSPLDTDLGADDVPILTFVADGTGLVTLSISMADCSDQPCGYGYRVYLAD